MPRSPFPARSRRSIVANGFALAITLVAWGPRLYNLGAQSLWVDEGFSWDVARGGFQTIFSTLAAEDRHPPLHYLLLWLTIRLAGSTEFALRFLSAGAAILAIPLVYLLGRRLGGDRVGLVAAILLAASPFHVWYAQEARMYALLTTLGLASFLLWLRLLDGGGRRTTAAYVVVTAAALLTHYFAFFLLPAQLGSALLQPGWRARWRGWAPAIVLAVLAFSPWSIELARQASRAPRGFQPDLGLPNILATLAATYLTGENATIGRLGVALGLVLALVGLLPGDATEEDHRSPSGDGRNGLILLLWILAAPVGAYLFSASVGIDVRASGRMYYLAGLPAFAILVARGLTWLDRSLTWWLRWPASFALPLASVVGLALAIVVIDLPALRTQYVEIVKEDFRTAANLVNASEWPGDAVVLDAEYIFRPFTYYYTGSAPWFRASVEANVVDAVLSRQTAGHGRVWLVLDHEDVADPQHRVQTWLDQHGTTLDERWLRGLHVRLYSMERRPNFDRSTLSRPVSARFGDVAEIVAVDAPGEAVGGTTMRVALGWHALAPFAENLHAVLMLMDKNGRVHWQSDRVPISPWYVPKSWQPGEFLTDRYNLAVPLGLPPDTYTLKLKLYAPSTGRPLSVSGSDDVSLASVRIDPSIAATVLPGRDLRPALRLLDATANPGKARPGDDIETTLLWQSTGPVDLTVPIQVRLVDSSGQIAVQRELLPVGETHSVERWQPREVVEDREVLKLPATVSPGTYRVQIVGQTVRDAGLVDIVAITRQFENVRPAHVQTSTLGPSGAPEKPVAELVGYNLESATLQSGTKAHLSLFWRARGGTPIDYAVFAHLLGPDGKVRGQHDSQPAAGTRRTSSWVTGEIVQDDHDLPLADGSSPGQYTIEVGMYRADTGDRLLADGNRNAIVLETRIQVAAAR